MNQLLLYISVLGATYLGVLAFRRLVKAEALIDHPNERSSHRRPTLRGGGVVIVVVTLTVLNLYSVYFGWGVLVEFTVGALMIAGVSLWDDVRAVPAWGRLIIHSAAATVAISGLGSYTAFEVPYLGIFHLGMMGPPLTFLWIVWLVNAYNFMDGIDGIAALQSGISGLGLACVGVVFNQEVVAVGGLCLSASSIGFLMHNWSPARIFMGDVGSAYLGYCLAVLPLMLLGHTRLFDARIPIIGVGLVWLFVFDAVLTLVYRIARKEPVWRPHRKHIYQRLVVAGLPHSVVAGAYGAASMLTAASILVALFYRDFFLRIIGITLIAETALLLAIWFFRREIASLTFVKRRLYIE